MVTQLVLHDAIFAIHVKTIERPSDQRHEINTGSPAAAVPEISAEDQKRTETL